MREKSRIRENRKERQERFVNAAIGFIMLVSLGFPGKYEVIVGEQGDMAFQYLSFGLQIMVMLSAGRNVMEWRLVDVKLRYWSLYLMAAVFFAGSMAVTGYPREQFVTCVRFTVLLLFALWLSENREPEENLRLFCMAQAVFAASVLMFIVLYPDRAFVREVGEHDFTGILRTKNNAAAEVSFGLVLQAALYRIMRDEGKQIPRWFVILSGAQLTLLALCSSVGALVYAAVPAFFVLALSRRCVRGLPLGILYVAGSVGFLIAVQTVMPIAAPVLEAIGKDATLTGRIPLWRQIIQVMTQHRSFMGWGFCMFWRDRRAVALIHTAFSRYSFMGSMTTGAHNVLLELWLDTGLFGVAAFFLAMLVSTSQIKRLKDAQYVFCAAVILWFFLHGLLERAFSPSSYHTLSLLMAMGTACKKPRLQGRRWIREEDREQPIGTEETFYKKEEEI
jgi:exopolysaccharide production protein ExoQ